MTKFSIQFCSLDGNIIRNENETDILPIIGSELCFHTIIQRKNFEGRLPDEVLEKWYKVVKYCYIYKDNHCTWNGNELNSRVIKIILAEISHPFAYINQAAKTNVD